MYPSDYGFAVGGNVRTTCLEKNLYNYNEDNCYENNWIYLPTVQWLLTPYTGFYSSAFFIYNNGIISDGYTTDIDLSVKPTLYLKSNVIITEGTGTEENPYKFELT